MKRHHLKVTAEGHQLQRVELDGEELAIADADPGLRVEFGGYGEPEVFLHLLVEEVELDLQDVTVDELRATGLRLTEPDDERPGTYRVEAGRLAEHSEVAFAQGHDELAEHLADAAAALEEAADASGRGG